MKALTLWQPWASLIRAGAKRVETRCWSTAYRGLLAIHASQKMPPRWLGASRYEENFRIELANVFCCHRDGVEYMMRRLPLGSILCIAKLHDIRPAEQAREILCERELIFGNYEDGRFAWFLEVIQTFDPIPAKGNRLLWNWKGTI